MAVSISRKKPRMSKKLQANELGFFYSFLLKILFRVPAAIFLLILIYIWSSSTTIISGNIVHVCVSSRKLSSNLYCLSAGTQPNFQIPVSVLNRTSSTPNGDLKEVADFSLKNSVPTGDDDRSAISRIDGGNANSVSRSSIPAVDRISGNETVENAFRDDGDDMSAISRINGGDANLDSGSSILAVDKIRNETIDNAFRDVEEHIRTHRSWLSDSNNPTTCEGRGIYVYELPSKFNTDLLAQCGEMIPWIPNFCEFFSNGGLGEPIEGLGEGWYHTHQYSLEPIFHERVLKHPCRVYDPNNAILFYVPYYGGLDILRWHFKNVSNDVKDSLALDIVRWLETQGSWYRNLGRDHVFVLGKISWDFRRKEGSTWGTRLLELDEMQNPMKLMIERHPWHTNDVGIPHPTYFHPRSDDDIIAWQIRAVRSRRGSLVGFAGAARPGAPESIRSVLIDQCGLTRNRECRYLNCSSGECEQAESVIGLFLESEFCLQPPGDSPTRKSVFDSIVSGCIPVMFDPFTAYYQYPWHFPEDWTKYSVFIDKEEVRNKSVNVVERLVNIPDSERENMRRYIVYELLPGLVYGDPNSTFDKFRDAFSITMNNLLERARRFNEV